MKFWVYIGLALLPCGCNRGDSVTKAGDEAAINGSELVNQASNAPENTLSPRLPEEKPNIEKRVTSQVSTETVSASLQDLGQILAPIAKDECFFSAPELRKEIAVETKNESTDTEPRRDSIRLLGFIQVGSDGTDRNQAILRIEGKLAYVAEGDRADEWEVLSISPPEVTLQRHRQRWSISLNDQPRSQPASTGRFVSTIPRGNAGRNHRTSGQSAVRSNSRIPSPNATPDIDPIQPDAVSTELVPPEPVLPELPQLPELPELPDPPELPSDPALDE